MADSALLKKRDAWWTVLIVDRVAIPIARRLRDVRWITPNRVSVTGLIMGIASGALFIAGDLLWGGILFELRFLLDCIDGKLARMRNAGTPLGAFIDLAGDKAIIAWNFGALSWHLQSQQILGAHWPILLVGSYLLRSWLVLYRIRVNDGDPEEWEMRFGLKQDGLVGAYRRWMARYRLVGRPNSIDVENVTCFLLPVVAGPVVTAAGIVVATVYYALVVLLYWSRISVFLASSDD